MKRISFLLLGVGICLSAQRAMACDVVSDGQRRADESAECAIALIKAPSGYWGSHSGYLYEPDASGGYGCLSLSFSDCGPRGALAAGGTLVRAGQHYFYLRLEAGKWCVGVPGSEYFWSYPLPSVAVADGVYLIAVPRAVVFSCYAEEPGYNAVKKNHPFFLTEHAADYQLLDGMIKIGCNIASLYSCRLSESLRSPALRFWRSLVDFANWCGGAVVTDFPPSFSYESIRVFVEEVERSVTPAHLPAFIRLGSRPRSMVLGHDACVLGAITDCSDAGDTPDKLASPTGVTCRAGELGEVAAVTLPARAEQSGEKAHGVARKMLIRGKRSRA